jgi:hypothetical protein
VKARLACGSLGNVENMGYCRDVDFLMRILILKRQKQLLTYSTAVADGRGKVEGRVNPFGVLQLALDAI